MKDLIAICLLFSIVLFSLLVHNHKTMMSFTLYVAVFFLLVAYYHKQLVEKYDKMDFFPWNEVNLVKKRIPESTVIDCAWYLDKQKMNNNIFRMSDPVVSGYSNQSS